MSRNVLEASEPWAAARARATSAPKNTASPCVAMTTPARRRVILPGTP